MMRVTVLRGGPSAEREVSLVSGRAVAEGLRAMGHEVYESDISLHDLSGLRYPAEVIFPVLHGEFGESGELQEIMEGRGLKFVGSGSKASRLGMDKVATKQAWEKARLPTPPYRVITSLDEKIPEEPCVVKAIASGSSIGVVGCKGSAEGPGAAQCAVATVLKRYKRALVEKFISGPELTVGL